MALGGAKEGGLLILSERSLNLQAPGIRRLPHLNRYVHLRAFAASRETLTKACPRPYARVTAGHQAAHFLSSNNLRTA